MSNSETLIISINDIDVGSPELNRMRELIKTSIPAVVAQISELDMQTFFARHANSDDVTIHMPLFLDEGRSCGWTVAISRSSCATSLSERWHRINKVEFICNGSVLFRYDNNSVASRREGVSPSLENMSLVFRSRQRFLDDMMEDFPRLRESLQTFVQAARTRPAD